MHFPSQFRNIAVIAFDRQRHSGWREAVSGAIAIQLHVIQNVTYGEEAVLSTFF